MKNVIMSFFLDRLLMVLVLSSSSVPMIFGQDRNHKSNLEVNCVFPRLIRDSTDLNLKITIKNISDSPQVVYNDLTEGSFNDLLNNNSTNFKLVVQLKNLKGYHPYFNGSFVDPGPETDTIDHHTKVTLASNDSVVIYYHADERYKFDPGYYRLKCLYWNNVHINKSIESGWVYFRVLKTIYVKHYYLNAPSKK